MGEGRDSWRLEDAEASRVCVHWKSNTPINRAIAVGACVHNHEDWEVVLCNRDNLTRLTSDKTKLDLTESISGTAHAIGSSADVQQQQ